MHSRVVTAEIYGGRALRTSIAAERCGLTRAPTLSAPETRRTDP